MIRIEIDDATLEEKTVVSKRDGLHYLIREQNAWASLGGKYPERCKLNLDDGQRPWPVGHYVLDPKNSLEVNRYGGLSIKRHPNLVTSTIQQAAKSA